jgi:hypothetical protein
MGGCQKEPGSLQKNESEPLKKLAYGLFLFNCVGSHF